MKGTILVLLLIVGSIQLKAQQLLQAKPDVKLNNGLQNSFKPGATYLSPPSLLLQTKNTNSFNTPGHVSRDSVTFYSTMPVAKVSSNDRMPIVAPRNRDITYTMPVIKIGIVNPLAPVQRQQP